MTLARKLEQGIAELGLDLPQQAVARLLDYLALIKKWNRVYNLTAIREDDLMVSNHLLDSLSIVPHVDANRCADIGTGAGLPGMVLAIAKPDCRLTLVETNGKKSTFLRQACIELGLGNVEVVSERAENYQPEQLFPQIVSRAFAELAEFARVSRHLCQPDGLLLAMKGQLPRQEIDNLPGWVGVERVIALKVPGLEASRHLVVLKIHSVTH